MHEDHAQKMEKMDVKAKQTVRASTRTFDIGRGLFDRAGPA